MAKARRKFTSRTNQPFLFEIDGADFATVGRVPGAMFVDFIRLLQRIKGEGRNVEDVAEVGDTIYDMYSCVMEPEEFDRFWKWARSPEGCDFETLIEVVSEMVAEDADRPTKRPTRSAPGPRPTGPTSTED